ncbi:MAG: hypothetical protein ACMUIE_01385 [Thermoplasmatota archaeon]
MKKKLISIIGISLTFLALAPMIVILFADEGEAQDPGQPMMLNDMRLHLREGMTMSPIAPESQDEFQAISIPNGFIRDGFFGWNLLPIGHVYWQPVGTWSTDPLKGTINLGGKVTVTIFATREEGSGNVNSDFLFEILRGSEPLIQLTTSANIQDGIDNKIEATGWFPAANDTTVEANTQLSLRITARCNGGAIMKYGSTTVDSGISFGSNALSIKNLFMDRKYITLEYTDAFMAPWINLYTQLKVNEIVQPDSQNAVTTQWNTLNRSRELIWERDSPPGNYLVEISISYDYTGAQNITEQRALIVQKPKESSLEHMKHLLGRYKYVILAVIAIIAVPWGLSRWRKGVWKRRFRELPHEFRELPKGKKKALWKKAKKDRTEKRKDLKKEERERREKEREEGKFSLFKRPDEKRERIPRRRHGRPIEAEVLSEDAGDLEL